VIPQGFIQDLLARTDIVEVVGRYVQLKKAGQNYSGLCPFHGEKNPSFTVSPSKQFFHCFGCGAHGSALGFLMDHRGLPYVEAIKELAQQVGLPVPESAPRDAGAAAARTQGLTELLEKAAQWYRAQLKLSPAAINYLKGRGIAGPTAARFALGYSPDTWQGLRAAFDPYDDPRLAEAGLVIADEGKRYDRFRGRVMFPIRNRRGAVLGFGARVLGAGEPKYLNSPETPVFHKGQELYGIFEAHEAIRSRKRAIVCEGYLDVIQLAQAGFAESVAALGTAVTAQHVTALFRMTDHVIFAFDGDAAGRKAARRALESALPVIGEAKRASFVLLPQREDPDSLIRTQGAAAFEQEISTALPLSRWFIKTLAEGRDLAQAEGRAALLNDARPLVLTMAAGALRQQLVRELAEAVRTPAEEIEGLFGISRPRASAAPARRPLPLRASAKVEDLKSRILLRLIAFPELARDFNAPIAAECVDSEQPIDRQIVEVWRAATGATATTVSTSGALLELLTNSEHVAAYHALAARDMLQEDDALAARADLDGAFAKLELARVAAERDALARVLADSPTPEARERYRALEQRHIRLKRALAGLDAPVAR
jgi:DNA primase